MVRAIIIITITINIIIIKIFSPGGNLISYDEGKKYMEGFEILKERYNSILLNYINSLLYNR